MQLIIAFKPSNMLVKTKQKEETNIRNKIFFILEKNIKNILKN